LAACRFWCPLTWTNVTLKCVRLRTTCPIHYNKQITPQTTLNLTNVWMGISQQPYNTCLNKNSLHYLSSNKAMQQSKCSYFQLEFTSMTTAHTQWPPLYHYNATSETPLHVSCIEKQFTFTVACWVAMHGNMSQQWCRDNEMLAWLMLYQHGNHMQPATSYNANATATKKTQSFCCFTRKININK